MYELRTGAKQSIFNKELSAEIISVHDFIIIFFLSIQNRFKREISYSTKEFDIT
jgi:hypothetical protein